MAGRRWGRWRSTRCAWRSPCGACGWTMLTVRCWSTCRRSGSIWRSTPCGRVACTWTPCALTWCAAPLACWRMAVCSRSCRPATPPPAGRRRVCASTVSSWPAVRWSFVTKAPRPRARCA
ncbi:MAG TPA: hypothetical protein DIT63_05775 [Gammaproteobacteria bacterium]|nr:hypothetical protein [Gammaproteobacteria bacterium]